jgi:hypothetical protein
MDGGNSVGKLTTAELLTKIFQLAEQEFTEPAFVLLKEKRAFQKGWPNKRPSLKEVIAHLERSEKNSIGIQPASLDCVVLDCDDGDGPDAAAEWAGEALACVTPSSSGLAHKGHVWVRCDKPNEVGNGKFTLEDPISGISAGDLRSSGGQVRLTDKALEILCASPFFEGQSMKAEGFSEIKSAATSSDCDPNFDPDHGREVNLADDGGDALEQMLEQPDDRSDTIFALAGNLKSRGVSFNGALEFLEPHTVAWIKISTGEDDEKYAGKGLKRQLNLAWEKHPPFVAAADDFDDDIEQDLQHSADKPKPKPQIRVQEGKLVRMEEAAKKALFIGAEAEILQRHGQLVRPVRLGKSEVEGGVRRNAGATVLMPINEHWLQKRMAQTATWYRKAIEKPTQEGGKGKSKMHPTDPPVKVARLILSDQGDWPFHTLVGMVAGPTVDIQTGRTIDTPGIDPDTGLLAVFDPGDFPRIDPTVEREGATERMNRVEHALFRGMPFVDEPSRAVAMSALITALVRPTLKAAPMHIFDAAMAGTGKSKMASVVGVLATGVEPSASAWARSDEENEKRIASLFRRGDPVVLFDNVDARRGDKLDGNILNIVLTQDPASIRVLGKTEDEVLNTRLMVMATGNNVVVTGDSCRRVVKCRLDAKCSEPERREFDFDPVKVAKTQRPKLVVDLLEALAAYILAGKPTDPPPLGSFEDWTTIRGMLIWCGYADPAETIADVKAADQDRNERLFALENWHLAFEDSWVTGAELEAFVAARSEGLESEFGHEMLEACDAMIEFLFDRKTDKTWIGRALSKTDGLAAGDFYLKVKTGRSAQFRVTKQT